MAQMQRYMTSCDNCGSDMYNTELNLTGGNEIIVDFIDGMDFKCDNCGSTTYIELNKFTDN